MNLKEDGYIVLPGIPEDEIPALRQEFQRTLREFPEFTGVPQIGRKRRSRNKQVYYEPINGYVLGGFSALANAASFHNPLVRKLRMRVHKRLRPMLADLADDQGLPYIEQIIDRMLFRPVHKKASRESWHRDEAKGTQDRDIVLGGWINLDATSQYFSACPGTHRPASTDDPRGFATMDGSEYEARKQLIEIPPGHLLIFYEDMVHEVVPESAGRRSPMMRLFVGFRLTEDTQSLIPDLDRLLEEQAPMPLKSGQRPPMYSTRHLTSFRDMLETFSQSIAESCKEKDGPKIGLVRRYMPSLAEISAKYPAYTPEELAILRPHRP